MISTISVMTLRYAIVLFCHCILVFFNFDIGNSSFAVVICHFHSVRFNMLFCQGNMHQRDCKPKINLQMFFISGVKKLRRFVR